MSAGEVTLFSILRRSCTVEGFGFNSHLPGTAEVCKGDKLDESQVTYRVPAGLITRVNGANNDGSTTYKFIVGGWCSGSTLDFDSSSTSSILVSPAKHMRIA